MPRATTSRSKSSRASSRRRRPISSGGPSRTVLRQPSVDDAPRIWQLVNESGTLDRNSPYLYLLLCRDFSDTCLVAEYDGELAGFVSAYRLPDDPRVLFVWQIAVANSRRREGLGLRLLRHLASEASPSDGAVRYIEATIAPSNTASRRLFESLARDLGTLLVDVEGFAASNFPAGESHDESEHEAEPRIRIGPYLRT